jgi:hypothetical protein
MLPPRFKFNIETPPEEYGGISHEFVALLALVERQDYLIEQNAELIRLLGELNAKTRSTLGQVIG